MYKRISACLKDYGFSPLKGKILGISGLDNIKSLIDLREAFLTRADFPGIDMQRLPYPENNFDVVISDQVIEHLEDPKKAIQESLRVLKPSGIMIHTTCFINYLHPAPKDFYRFSCDALMYLCRGSAKIIQCEGWGNRLAILVCFLSNRLRFKQIPETKWNILNFLAVYKEEKYPIVTWVIAIK